MKSKWICILGFISLTTLIMSCDGTKHLASGESLYLGPKIGKVQIKKDPKIQEHYRIREKQTKNIAIWSTAWAPPNGAFFGIPHLRLIPTRLMIYNGFYTEEESGFDYWMMNNFGAPPRSIEKIDPALRLEKIKGDLFAYGHFDAHGSYKIYPRKKVKKGRIGYTIFIPPAYVIDSVDYRFIGDYPAMKKVFEAHLQVTTLKRGDDFNLYQINDEKLNLLRRFQNEGYLYLTAADLEVLADTTGGGRTVDLRFGLRPDIPEFKLKPTTIEYFEVLIDTMRNHQTVRFENWVFKADTQQFNTRLIDRCVRIHPGALYRYQEKDFTLGNLASLGVFKSVSISYEPSSSDSTKARAEVFLQEANRFDVSIEGAITSKSNSFLGPSVGLRLKQKNLFGGAQNITYGIDAFLDFPTGALSQVSSNSYGLGLSAEYEYPVIRNPLGIGDSDVRGLPKGMLGLTLEYNNRADYFKVLNWRADYGIKWKSSEHISHRLNWITVNYSNLLETTTEFDSLIEANEQIRKSFEETFFIGPSYSFFFNNTNEAYQNHHFFLRFDADLSGNALYLAQSVLGDTEGDNKFLGLPYSQYIQFKIDGRYFWNFDDHHLLGVRISTGLGIALGNSDVMPYIKQFYVGGMNSLRPLAPRIVGPGTYLPFDEDLASANNITQSGDVLIEGNVEYRFPIVYKLKGALWADYGNIYLLNPDPLRPGGAFAWDTFLDKMVVTGGVGLRLDLNYLVLRLDYGWILHSPWFVDGERWIWENQLLLSGGVIGIGYPF